MVKNPQVIINHVGYDTESTKTAVFQGTKELKPVSFDVVNYATNKVVFSGTPVEVGEVARWNTGYYWTMRFDEVTETAKYYVVVKLADGTEYKSFPFMIAFNVIEMRTLSDANYYFKCQRPTGEVEWADKNLKFAPPREGTWDYRGGWADATGDIGIHMSHQSQTTYFNMQQSAFSAYAFFKVNDLLEGSDFPFYRKLKRRMLDEAFYGAEYIMRSHAPSGSFLQTKSRKGDAYTPVLTTRCIGHDSRFEIPKIKDMYELKAFYRKYEEEHEYTDYDYETSFRSGGGYCIATLAYAARTVYPSEFSKEEYIKTAVESYDYLYANNEKYTNDGKWNLTDEYCALDALTELYLSTREWDYIRRGEDMAQRMMDKYVAVDDTMGYLSVKIGRAHV